MHAIRQISAGFQAYKRVVIVKQNHQAKTIYENKEKVVGHAGIQ